MRKLRAEEPPSTCKDYQQFGTCSSFKLTCPRGQETEGTPVLAPVPEAVV
jgi:hypothetical protein